MPLSAEDKNLIAQGTATGLQIGIAQLAGLSALPSTALLIPFIPGLLGLQLQFNRVRFPRISPTDIGIAVQASLRGSVLSGDPFFGDIVISNPDQAEFLTELVRNSAIRRVVAEQDTSRLFLQRRAVIEGLAETAEERGFATAIDPSLRGQAFRATADAPIQFIERDFLT